MAAKSLPAPTPQTIRDRVMALPRRFRPESANGLVADVELRVGEQTFAISVREHACTVTEGPAQSPSTVVTVDPPGWVAIDNGRLTGGDAFFDHRLLVGGNLDLAVRLQTLFRPHGRTRARSDLDQVLVQADGLSISCYLMGSGPPVLLLHGLGGSKITWLPILSALAKTHRAIVPDLPGHGESAKPVGDYSPRFYARVLRSLLEELEVQRATVLGNSLGGRVALELALRSPERVAAMALLAPSLPGLRWRYLMGFTRVFPTEIGAIPFPMRERWMRLAIRRLFARPEQLSDEGYAAAAAEFIRIYRDPRARVAFFSSLRHIVTEPPEPFFESLRQAGQRTLVIFGEQDRLVPPRLGMKLIRCMPNAEMVLLPGVGHVPQFEATAQTREMLAEFLAGGHRTPRRPQ